MEINVNHQVNSTYNENITLKTKFDIISHNESDVYIFYISPQYNKLNFEEKMVECILNTYILSNIGINENNEQIKNNKLRYENKNITHVIMTLDANEPIFINLKNINDVRTEIILYDHCISCYDCYNNEIISHFKYETECYDEQNGVECDINMLNQRFLKILTKIKNKTLDNKIPSYIHQYLTRIECEIIDDDADSSKYYNADYKQIYYGLTNKITKILKNYFGVP